MVVNLKNILLVVSVALTQSVSAQTESEEFTARNALYLEIGGSSGRYAVNYNRIFYQKDKLKLTVSAGFALWHYTVDLGPEYKRTSWHPAIPIELTTFWGKSKHHLEFGVGFVPYWEPIGQIAPVTLEISEKTVFNANIPLRLGYRYQKPEGGFFFRVGYTPYFILPVGGREEWVFEPRFAGISIGKSF
jgi:hypothetical protein